LITQTNIPRLIRSLREKTGLTQEKFATRLGVTLLTINRWENGRARPSPLAMQRVEELLRSIGNSGDNLLSEFLSEKKF
jgi:putative transcriptional regulator